MENNRPLGWTTLEEAKLLVDAGLDPNTADMSYNFVVCKVINGNPSEDWLLQPFPPDDNQPHEQLPCWSLGALEKLIPDIIKINDANFHFRVSYDPTHKWSLCYDDFMFRRNIMLSYFKTQIELYVNILKNLLANGYIKKHE